MGSLPERSRTGLESRTIYSFPLGRQLRRDGLNPVRPTVLNAFTVSFSVTHRRSDASQ